MRCPKCGCCETRVIDSRSQEATNAIKRRRECSLCGHRFTTFERCEDPLTVEKRDGSSQPFDRSKLLAGLVHATAKRDIELSKLNGLIDDIEHELRARSQTSVTSRQLGDMVLMRLKRLDKVAYIRFASVYRDFKDVDEFTAELNRLV